MANTTHEKTHAEHILPLQTYFGVFFALLVLTAVTVYVAKFNFGAFNLVVAMGVAAVKASLVALIFMHLKYDNKIFAMIFIASIAFLAILIGLTMADTLTRGRIDPAKDAPLIPEATIYRARGMESAPPDSPSVEGMAPAGGVATEEDADQLDSVRTPDVAGPDSLATDSGTADTIRRTDSLGAVIPGSTPGDGD